MNRYIHADAICLAFSLNTVLFLRMLNEHWYVLMTCINRCKEKGCKSVVTNNSAEGEGGGGGGMFVCLLLSSSSPVQTSVCVFLSFLSVTSAHADV